MEPPPYSRLDPETLAFAAADAFTRPPWLLPASGRRSGANPEQEDGARAAFLQIGAREGYTQEELAPMIGRSQPQASRLQRRPLPEGAFRIVRTLATAPGIVEHLPWCTLPAASVGPRRGACPARGRRTTGGPHARATNDTSLPPADDE